jgi:hypothetical protein
LLGQPRRSIPRPNNLLIKQVEEASQNAPVGNSTISDVPKIIWQQRHFVLESHIQKKSKGRRSWIGSQGFFLAELNPDDTVKEYVWACRPCGERGKGTFFKAQSTSSAIEHLRK